MLQLFCFKICGKFSCMSNNCIFFCSFSKKLPSKEKLEEFYNSRYELVQQLPRLCFAVCDVIMYLKAFLLALILLLSLLIYVVQTGRQQDVESEIKEFIVNGKERLESAPPVDLIVVYNRTIKSSDATGSIETDTAEFIKILGEVLLQLVNY